MICPKCGAQLEDNAKFCIRCGSGVAAAGPMNSGLEDDPLESGARHIPDGKKIAVVLSGIVLVLVIGLVVLLLGFRNTGNRKDQDNLLLHPENRPETSVQVSDYNVLPQPSPTVFQDTDVVVTSLAPAPPDFNAAVVKAFEHSCRVYYLWVQGRTGTLKSSVTHEDPDTGILVSDGASYADVLSTAFSNRYVNGCLERFGVDKTDAVLMLPDSEAGTVEGILSKNPEYLVTRITDLKCKLKVSWTEAGNTVTYYLEGSKQYDSWVFDDAPEELKEGQTGIFGTVKDSGTNGTATVIRPSGGILPSHTPIPVPSATVAPSHTPIPVPSATAAPSHTPVPTPTPRPSSTPAPTATPTPTAKPTATPTATPTAKPSPTATATPSAKPSPTATATPTAKPTSTPTAKPSPTATAAPSEKPSPKPSPSEEPTPSPSPSEEPSPEPSPSEEPSPEPSPSEEPSPEPSPSEEPSPEPSPSEEPSPEPSPSEEPSPKPSPVDPSVTYEVENTSVTNSAGADCGTIEVPKFSSAAYDSDENVKQIVDNMNAAREQMIKDVLDRCAADSDLTSCSVETKVLETGDYVSILLKGEYTSGDSVDERYDGVILDRGTGKAVEITKIFNHTQEELETQVGGPWEAAAIEKNPETNAVEAVFYLISGGIKRLPMP